MIKEHRVIDSHCHIYPPKIAAKAVAGTDHFYGSHSVLDGSAETLRANPDVQEFFIGFSEKIPPQGSWDVEIPVRLIRHAD